MFYLKNTSYKNILKSINLKIEKPVTLIVGESGSGKTTLLRLLNKLISPTTGAIFYNELNISEIESVLFRKKVAMLSQLPIIYEGNIKDNLLVGLKFQKKKLQEDLYLEKILSDLNLKQKLTDSCENLSGGEKQRLCLARLILTEPEVYLLDEPSSALDKNGEKLIIEYLIKQIANTNKQLIIVSHSVELKKYADEIITIKKGEIVNE